MPGSPQGGLSPWVPRQSLDHPAASCGAARRFFQELCCAHTKGARGGGGAGWRLGRTQGPGAPGTPEASSSWSRAKRWEAAAEGGEEGACPSGADCSRGSRGARGLESRTEGREGGAECVAGGSPRSSRSRLEARARADLPRADLG